MDMTLPEADLVRRCRDGDADAFRPLADRYYRAVCSFLYRKVQRPDVTEDLAQETFLAAYRALRDGQTPEKFGSWLMGIAHNHAGKWLRRKKPATFAPDDPPAELPAETPFDAVEALEEQQALLGRLESSLADLPPETRRLLDLKHRHGWTCERIAAEVGKPVGTVKSLLARTYQALRHRLRPAEELA